MPIFERKRMTDQGSNLPADILDRVALRKREALEAEIQGLEEMISAGMDRHLAERRVYLDGLTETGKKASEEAALKELEGLQTFGEATLRRLDAELLRRRTDRIRDENRRREERIVREKKEEEAKKRQAEEEARKKKAAADDPSAKVRTILKHVQRHMEQGDLELAAKSIAEGLEIDGFNAELLDLDAKVREEMASDTFSGPAPPGGRREKRQGEGEAGEGQTGEDQTAETILPHPRPARATQISRLGLHRDRRSPDPGRGRDRLCGVHAQAGGEKHDPRGAPLDDDVRRAGFEGLHGRPSRGRRQGPFDDVVDGEHTRLHDERKPLVDRTGPRRFPRTPGVLPFPARER